MEQDRFQANSKLYILGMICLVLCLGFLFLSLYILPYLIWDLHYTVPAVVVDLVSKFQDDYEYPQGTSKAIVWLIFFIPSVITGLISYFVSNFIDNRLYKTEVTPEENQENLPSGEVKRQIKESAGLGLKIFFLMILIIIVLLLLQFFAQSTA